MSLRGSNSLMSALNRIKDIRNLCAHDERLYCARVGKPAIKSVEDVLDDFQLVVCSKYHQETVSVILNLKDKLSQAISPIAFNYVNEKMSGAKV